MNQISARKIELEFEIQTRKPIDPQAFAAELIEVIKSKYPEGTDLQVKVTIEPRPLEKKP
jgi:hypothetical protein